MSSASAMHDPIKIYDARWEVHEFDDAQVTRLFEATLAYAREIDVDTVVFTRDARLAAGHVMELGVEAATRLGFTVYIRPEPISTPQSYFTTHWVSRERPNTMGLAVTASHNPAAYVGVKFTVPTVQAIGYDCGPAGGLTRVREIYHSDEAFAGSEGASLRLLDLGREYIDYSLDTAGVEPGSLAGLKVVLDAFNGSAGPELWMALTKAGVQVIPVRLIPDGNFPTGSPNPTSQGKMDRAVELAKEHKADVVLGIDGDGDRIVFGDQRGILTAGFVTLPIIEAAGAANQQPLGKVLYDPKVSPLALAEWGRLGVEPVLFRNGHSQIKDYMKQIGAVAAAEESGHYYHRLTLDGQTVASENSTMTILLFLGAVKRDPELLGRLWSLQNRIYTTGEFNYQFENDAARDAAMAAVLEHFAARGGRTVTHTADGIDLQGTVISRGVDLSPGHVKLEDGWYSGYLRIATNERAVVRSYFSTGDETIGRAIEQEARAILGDAHGGRIVD